jgi:hypothetical protein
MPRHLSLRSTVLTTLAFSAPLVFGLTEAIRGAWVSEEFLAWARSPDEVAPSPHFLWSMLVVALHRAGFELVALARYLPLVCWAGLLAVLVVHAVRSPLGRWSAHTPLAKGTRQHLHHMAPVAAWGVALHGDAQIHASGGLETSLFALLLTGGLLLVVNHPRQNALGAAVFALAALVRPEGGIYFAIASAYVLWRGGLPRLIRFVALWGLLVVPCWVRLGHRGVVMDVQALFPSVSTTACREGWQTTWQYFRVYWVLLVCVLGTAGGLLGMLARRHWRDPRLDAVVLGLACVLAAVIWVLVHGRDTTSIRIYIAVTPMIYLIAEEMIRMTGDRKAVAALAALVILGTLAAR